MTRAGLDKNLERRAEESGKATMAMAEGMVFYHRQLRHRSHKEELGRLDLRRGIEQGDPSLSSTMMSNHSQSRIGVHHDLREHMRKLPAQSLLTRVMVLVPVEAAHKQDRHRLTPTMEEVLLRVVEGEPT